MGNKRNYSYDFVRFLLCCIICLYHLSNMKGRLFSSGYLSVDLFFILSGFFLMRHFYSDHSQGSPEEMAVVYLKGRLWRTVPHHFLSWIVMAFICVYPLKKYAWSNIPMGWSELLLIKSTGIGNDISINGVTWYLSSLLICSYLIYWVLCMERKLGDEKGSRYAFIISPLVFFWVMSHIWFTRENLSFAGQKAVIFTGGLLRGISEIGLGCTAFTIAERIKAKTDAGKRSVRLFATCFELAGWTAVLLIMFSKGGKKDFVIPILGMLLFVSMWSANSYLNWLFNRKICGYLGRVSFAMFLNQLIIINPMKKFFANHSIWIMGPLMLLSIFSFSALSDWFTGKATAAIQSKRGGNRKN